MGRHGSVRHRRDDLAQCLGPHISHRVHTGDVCLRILSRQDIAAAELPPPTTIIS